MAESYIQITEGAGPKFRTVTYSIAGSTVHEEVVKIGEAWEASYTVPPTVISTVTASSHILELMAGSSLKLRVRRIEIHQVAMATAAIMCEWVVTRVSSAGTGGGVVTPSTLDPANSASGATAMTLPTVKGSNSTTIWTGSQYMQQTLAVTDSGAKPLVIDFEMLHGQPLTVASGTSNGIALQNNDAVAGATVRVDVFFSETSY